jgi:hypothetical protein
MCTAHTSPLIRSCPPTSVIVCSGVGGSIVCSCWRLTVCVDGLQCAYGCLVEGLVALMLGGAVDSQHMHATLGGLEHGAHNPY